MTAQDRFDVYEYVTATVIRQLEEGVAPWQKPWSGGNGGFVMPLRANGEAYRGVNILLLWAAADERGFGQRRWMTFKQALAAGGAVRKGEKGSKVVYANTIQREVDAVGDGDPAMIKIPFMKAYTVFNVEQIDGLSAEYFDQVAAPIGGGPEPIAAAEAFFAGLGADIRTGGDRAFYTPTQDFIQMPPLAAFLDAPSYYATLAHESVHWTRHASRLNRDLGRVRAGDSGYAREELVAEIGAAFLAVLLGLYCEPRADHAAYIGAWLEILKEDKRAIFQAASHAQKAVDYLTANADAKALAA